MAIKLSETQFSQLSAAVQRTDHFFTFPEVRRKAAAWKAVAPVLAAGSAREVRARDEDGQCAFARKLTAAGVKAIATFAHGVEAGSRRKPAGGVKTEPASTERRSLNDGNEIARDQTPAAFVAPRSGTKIDGVVKMLGRPEGATLEAIVEATG